MRMKDERRNGNAALPGGGYDVVHPAQVKAVASVFFRPHQGFLCLRKKSLKGKSFPGGEIYAHTGVRQAHAFVGSGKMQIMRQKRGFFKNTFFRDGTGEKNDKFSVIQLAHNIRRTEKGGKDAPGISGSLLLHSFCVRTRNGSRTA